MSELDPVFAECAALSEAKQRGYGSALEPFHNVIEGARFAGIEPFKAALLRAADKFTRIGNLIGGDDWGDESFEDNAKDAINYLAMAVALRRRESQVISLEPVRTLLAPDYPDRPHPSDPLKTEPEDWHVLEHGGPDA